MSLSYLWRFLFWTINRIFVITFIRCKFNVQKTKDSDKLPRPPFILISNHGTFFDPWIIGSYSFYPMSIMMNEFGFNASPFVRWYQKNAGAFSKKKGISDFKSLRIGMRELKKGYSVMIFPEGQVTWDGETQPFIHGIEKMVKHTAIPIVLVKMTGSFLSKPWWAESYRKGKVIIKFKTIMPDDIDRLNESDILDVIEKFVYNNDILEMQNQLTKFKGKNIAKGLLHFLWICKNCNATDSLSTKGDYIKCEKCGATWIIKANGKIETISGCELHNLFDWAKWHREIVKREIGEKGEYQILAEDYDVDYCKIDKNGKINVIYKGGLRLNSQYLIFYNTNSIEEKVRIAVKDIKSNVFQKKQLMECRTEEYIYFFRFNNGSVMKWIYYVRYLKHYEICEERKYL